MRPTPIPDNEVFDGTRRVVIGAPDGDLTNDQIRPTEALVGRDTIGPFFAMRIELDDGDLERLQAGDPFWLIQHGSRLAPFALEFTQEGS